MKGYRVRRVWGWDGHGLPIENKVENALEIKRKRDIEEKIGVKKFIEECKKYVNDVSEEWEWYVDHIGRWVDFKHAYKTWDTDYMESVMWVFKQMYDKGYVYKGLRVSLYCPHCATPISNFEVAMDAENYKEITDAATTYKYPLQGENNTYVLAWSTTPWNKIVTPALAVNPELTYVKVKPHFAEATRGEQEDEYYILAKSTLSILNEKYDIIEELPGKDLIGKRYIPHYDYYKIAPGEKAFEIIGGDFVTAEEGTGVVTIAAYGEEDLKVMKELNVHVEMHLDEEGNIYDNVPKFGGMYYLKANKAVNEDLAARGLIYKDEDLPHKVPLCWRCQTRLYYAPITAWYVNVQVLKEQMKKNNEAVNWFPSHFKYGRFLKSMENAPDWNISRNRYWGSPVPVWECECGERFVPGSIKELEEASGKKINDLHKPEIDDIIVTCKKCSKQSRRTPEVLDSWIEAGSASFAERHFPFVTTQGKPLELESFFPPDFIAEYTGQIRAWFYVLHVIGTALYDSPAFKNVVVEGVILGTDGRKMSKNFKNYPDPKEMLQKYGADALRLYLMGSPVMHGEDILISEETYRNQTRDFLLLIWNIYKFFNMYAVVDKWEPQKDKVESKNILDIWINSLLHKVVKDITADLEKYDTVETIIKMKAFVNDLSTWYLRRSRDRGGAASENEEDKNYFYSTLYTVLVTFAKVTGPTAPFIAEELYRSLTNEESVHLADWPTYDESLINEELIQDMVIVREIVEVGHRVRKEGKLKVRQPLASMKAELPQAKKLKEEYVEQYKELLQDELNVKQIDISYIGEGTEITVEFDTHITPELQLEGELRDLLRAIQAERKTKGVAMDAEIELTVPEKFAPFIDQIKKKVLASSVKLGDKLIID
jgi:isoleucyl-tRNA synthetase